MDSQPCIFVWFSCVRTEKVYGIIVQNSPINAGDSFGLRGGIARGGTGAIRKFYWEWVHSAISEFNPGVMRVSLGK
jgi:hypothetical protein